MGKGGDPLSSLGDGQAQPASRLLGRNFSEPLLRQDLSLSYDARVWQENLGGGTAAGLWLVLLRVVGCLLPERRMRGGRRRPKPPSQRPGRAHLPRQAVLFSATSPPAYNRLSTEMLSEAFAATIITPPHAELGLASSAGREGASGRGRHRSRCPPPHTHTRERILDG